MNSLDSSYIEVKNAREHNLKGFNVKIKRNAITVITGVSGSGKSSLAFDIVLAESNRRFFYTLSNYTRQFLDMGSKPDVGNITGLSPAVSLAQNETQPSSRATIGTLTDLNELIGVLFARYATKICPDHFEPTEATTVDQIVSTMVPRYEGKVLAICAPIANQKKGNFKQHFKRFSKKGYSKAYVDGSIVSILEPIELDREYRHDIKIIVDYVPVKANKTDRLARALSTAFELSEGFCELFESSKDGDVDGDFVKVSINDGCPVCNFSWPRLDARYFSMNSLGKCLACNGSGFIYDEDTEAEEIYDTPCSVCRGTGIRRDIDAIQYRGSGIHKVQKSSVVSLIKFFERERQSKQTEEAEDRLIEEILSQLKRIENIGLGYLTLERRLRSLSSGELQRLRLSSSLAENLRGVLYVLDEPSQGLGAVELDRLWESIDYLKRQGNTILIVDHDETIMKRADFIIDLGPGGGLAGGEIMAQFSPSQAGKFKSQSLTAAYLAEINDDIEVSIPEKIESSGKFIKIVGPNLNNLKIPEVSIPSGQLTVVTGVSGAGKSSLISGVLFRNLKQALNEDFQVKFAKRIEGIEHFERVSLVNRKPIAKSSVSMPATYLDIFTDLRQLYGKLPHSQIYGLTARHFSLSTDLGRCEACKGRGYQLLTMKFLADAKITCDVCLGARYKPQVLLAQYRGKSIADLLSMSISEAAEHLKSFKKITRKLQPAIDLGIGYLRLGQPSNSLSGGESQRLKLAAEFKKTFTNGHLIILDEPTTGLHISDVEKLLNQLMRLRSLGATVIVIEHHQHLIKNADWLLTLGPGPGAEGGNLVFSGPPSRVETGKTLLQ
ncbi:MAG: excinuclease ABC subunit UvrA [Pseudobacteriovorax sp.]|nr:excinuclease ABC subunit UvrA [Pseudobacteriovorax sp.]